MIAAVDGDITTEYVIESGLTTRELAQQIQCTIPEAERLLVVAAVACICGEKKQLTEAANCFKQLLSKMPTHKPGTLAKLIKLLPGISIARQAALSGIQRKKLLNAARQSGIHYRNRRPTQKEIVRAKKFVISKGLAIREASKRAGLSKSSVDRYVRKERDTVANQEADEVTFQSRSWDCPKHGRISYFPCVICTAEKNSRKGQEQFAE